MPRLRKREARLCAFCIDFCELRTCAASVAQTQQKEGSESRKVIPTLYNDHYVKLTLSYPQNLECIGTTVLVMHRQMWTSVNNCLWTSAHGLPAGRGGGGRAGGERSQER